MDNIACGSQGQASGFLQAIRIMLYYFASPQVLAGSVPAELWNGALHYRT